MRAAVGRNEGRRGPCGRKDAEPSERPQVKVREDRVQNDTQTELEHN